MRYAKIRADGIVENIIVADQEHIDTLDDAASWVAAPDGTIDELERSGVMPATVGGLYKDGKFIRPRPFISWTLDANDQWVAPKPMPTDGKSPYAWSEATGEWEAVPVITYTQPIGEVAP
jgi:hypothetical protein